MIACLANDPAREINFPPPPRPPDHVRLVHYGFTMLNESDSVASDGRFYTYAPVAQTSYQYCQLLSCSSPANLRADTLGNQVLEFKLDALPPYGQTIITIKAYLGLYDQAIPIPSDNNAAAIFTQSEPYIEADDPHITALAAKLKSASQNTIGRDLYDWIVTNINNGPYSADNLGALAALNQGQGDCSEMAFLFCALSRSAGLPARYMSGYKIDRNAVLLPYMFHNWAEVHSENAWRVVDPQTKSFMEQENNYIAFTIYQNHNELAHKLMGNHFRFHVIGKGLTASMNSQ